MLHSSTRESIGLDIKDCIVILDEAHNIIDTVNTIHSHSVSRLQVITLSFAFLLSPFYIFIKTGGPESLNFKRIFTLVSIVIIFMFKEYIYIKKRWRRMTLFNPSVKQVISVASQLSQYFERYKLRLSEKNSRGIQLLLRIVRGLKQYLRQSIEQTKAQTREKEREKSERMATVSESKGESHETQNFKSEKAMNKENAVANLEQVVESRVVAINDFLFSCGIDDINMFQVQRFVEKSELVRKVKLLYKKTKEERHMLFTIKFRVF